jgi:hypothetical protein
MALLIQTVGSMSSTEGQSSSKATTDVGHCLGSPYLTGNTLRLRYRDQQVNATSGTHHMKRTNTLWADGKYRDNGIYGGEINMCLSIINIIQLMTMKYASDLYVAGRYSMQLRQVY